MTSKIKRFGLIGHPLGHSLSPEIHRAILASLNVEGTYDLIDIPPERLAAELTRLQELDGYNCTIPHKQAILSHLDSLSPEAEKFQAVNTVFQGKGFNTDAAGFLQSNFDYRDKAVLILGTGGVSHTFAHCVAEAGAAKVVFQTREPAAKAAWLAELQGMYPHCTFEAVSEVTEEGFHFILNGTPLGMWPHAERLPLDRDLYQKLLHKPEIEGVFDAIYNPCATRFVMLAASAGVKAVAGLPMLIGQAVEAQRIWQGVEIQALPNLQADLTRRLLEKYPVRLVLSGFMGSGKSSTGRALAKALAIRFVDLDDAIVEQYGNIKEMFANEGEAVFRDRERAVLAEILRTEESVILATGGGALVQEGAEEVIRSYGGQIVFLDVSLETALARAKGDQRPLLNQAYEQVEKLYEKRRPLYQASADLTVNADWEKEERVRYLQEVLGLGK